MHTYKLHLVGHIILRFRFKFDDLMLKLTHTSHLRTMAHLFTPWRNPSKLGIHNEQIWQSTSSMATEKVFGMEKHSKCRCRVCGNSPAPAFLGQAVLTCWGAWRRLRAGREMESDFIAFFCIPRLCFPIALFFLIGMVWNHWTANSWKWLVDILGVGETTPFFLHHFSPKFMGWTSWNAKL